MQLDVIGWIFLKDRCLLAVRAKGKTAWYIPGGKREEGESDTQALIREVREELSVEIQTNTISYFETVTAQAHGREDGVIVQMACYMAEYTGDLKATSEIEAIGWIDSRTDSATIPPAIKIVLDSLKKRDLID